MQKKIVRRSLLFLGLLFLIVPAMPAQDLIKYRSFSLEATLAAVLKDTGQKPADAKLIHSSPALIQELTWWPPSLRGTYSESDSVEQVLFSFYNGQLYRISVTYDRNAVKGLTAEDLIQSISAKYGTPTKLTPDAQLRTDNQFDSKQKVLATWEDSLYSSSLVRSSYSEGYGLVILSKRLSAAAETANLDAVKLEERGRPEKEANQRKKEADDLETMRLKNRKIFQP
jgi:hypothetical protein